MRIASLCCIALLALPAFAGSQVLLAQAAPTQPAADTTGVRIVSFDVEPVVVNPGDTFTLTLDLEPETPERREVRLLVRANGRVVYSNDVDVSATGQTRVGLPIVVYKSGETKLSVNGRRTGAVWVAETPSRIVYNEIDLPGGTSAATDQAVAVKVLLQNVGGRAGTARPALLVDGAPVDSVFIALYPGETSDVTFSTRFARPGTYRLSSGTLPPVELDVTETSK